MHQPNPAKYCGDNLVAILSIPAPPDLGRYPRLGVVPGSLSLRVDDVEDFLGAVIPHMLGDADAEGDG